MRVSSNAQAEADTIERQREAIEERFGQVDGWYSDEGISGTILERPGFIDLLATLRRDDQVVIFNLDRLARQLVVQELLLREVWDKGASVESCFGAESENLVADGDPSRKFTRQVLGAAAEYAKDLTKLRLAAGRAAKRARGGWAGGNRPFGWMVDPATKELVPDPGEAPVVARIVGYRKAGHSLNFICELLNDDGVTTRSGGKWVPTAVSRVVTRNLAPKN